MLALSTFRQSKKAIELAIEMAKKNKNLLIVYVVDVNLARYLVGLDIGLYSDLEEKCEEELLKEHRIKGEEKVASIAKMAQKHGINVNSYLRIGRFALESLEIIKIEKPETIITTRSNRPHWVKKIFGSPVDYLIANAGCPVIDV